MYFLVLDKLRDVVVLVILKYVWQIFVISQFVLLVDNIFYIFFVFFICLQVCYKIGCEERKVGRIFGLVFDEDGEGKWFVFRCKVIIIMYNLNYLL